MPKHDFRKTLMIGLGGSGQLVLVHLKRMFLDAYGIVPPSIKLLALDADSSPVTITSEVSEKRYALDPEEFVHLKVEDPKRFIETMVGKWFVKPLPAGSIGDGAGAIRQVGRLSLFFHLDELRHRFDKLIANLNSMDLKARMADAGFNLSEKTEEIYVCGSLAGGTGSGTFLDVGILLRDQMPKADIHGCFLLNWIYRNKAFAHRVSGNVYAALCELDNLQSIKFGAPGFVPYKVVYGNRTIEVKEPPYTLFHLIDGCNEIGQNIDDVQRLCDVVASSIFLSTGVMGRPVTSAVDNLKAHISVSSPQLWGGRYARYSSLGVSSLYYPARELHRLEAAECALNLCRFALGASENETPPDEKAVTGSMETFFNGSEISRTTVRNLVCPSRPEVNFQVEKYEIEDREFPDSLKLKWEDEQKAVAARLDRIYESSGSTKVNEKRSLLAGYLDNMQKDVSQRTAFLRDWVKAASEKINSWDMEAAKEAATLAQDIENKKKSAEDLLGKAAKAFHIPFVGGARKNAAEEFGKAAEDHLKAIAQKKLLDFERQCYKSLQDALSTARPPVVPAGSQISKALTETETKLRKRLNRELKTLSNLQKDPTRVLIGGGKIVIVNERKHKLQDPALLPEAYGDFVRTVKISRPEDYLAIHSENPERLVSVFLEYTEKELEEISKVGIQQAMGVLARKESDVEAYYAKQFDDLFRLSSALWSYTTGLLNEARSPQYAWIINIGFPEAEEGETVFGKAIANVKPKYKISYDISLTTTGDPYTISLLRFAAALPLYFVNGLRESRDKYLEEITPTYHIDSYFEMNVPDLFPEDDLNNVALRVLGMAIVPCISVIHDQKLVKGHGHKFTCDADIVRRLNNDEPLQWWLFRDMYAMVKDTYNPKSTNNLLDILIRLLHEKVDPMLRDAAGKAELRQGIREYIDTVKSKLESRDFTRLISARLTYREVQALEEFLRHMDLEAYITGRGVERHEAMHFTRMGN
jgi:hypothetical protein